MMNVSVAMAAYNGSRFIKEQIASILPQLAKEDELVISLDPSTDDTELILQEIANNDARVHLLKGEGKGVIANFQNAINATRNEIVFLCDQDDIWMPNKIQSVKEKFETSGAILVMHDAEIVDADLKRVNPSFFATHQTKVGILHNLIRNSYIGCCMAFRRTLLPFILPFPSDIPMHDQWIGLMAEKHGKVELIREPLIQYRRHGDNVTKGTHAGILQMLKWRFAILKDVIKG